jgi:hypothetical protein
VTYFHTAILPVIVSPNSEQVISLDPELITPQDGQEKIKVSEGITSSTALQNGA